MAVESTPSRRELFRVGAVLATSSSLNGSFRASAAPSIVSQKNLLGLARSLKGRLILPGEVGFVQASLPRNTRYAERFPIAVAMCRDASDVTLCVGWARDNYVPFAIRSGGHNYAGFSTTRGLQIDVRSMDNAYLDLKNGLVRVDAGVNNRGLVDALKKTSFTVPAGRCWSVGVAGLTLGGGWGLSSNRLGLTCDSLVAANVVLANAKEVVADSRGSFADLFWALRGGGGGNFGVNTSFTFRLSDISGPVTTCNITWSGAKFVELMRCLQLIQNSNPKLLGMRVAARQKSPGRIESANSLEINCLGQFFGGAPKFMEVMAPAFSLLRADFADISEGTFWDAADKLGEVGQPDMSSVRSAYIQESLSDDGISTMLSNILKWPGGTLKQNVLGSIFSIGGRVGEIKQEQTAYFHRNAKYMFRIDVGMSPADQPDMTTRQIEWQNAYMSDMQRHVLPQTYVNFPSRDLEGWALAYYGANLSLLSRIKRRYDPDSVFKFEQSIPG